MSDDVTLDFLSPQFDPARALHADPTALRLPCPDIQPCDNLDAYDSVMRGVRRQAPSGAAREAATKKVEPSGGVAAVKAQRRFKSVLHFMECKDMQYLILLTFPQLLPDFGCEIYFGGVVQILPIQISPSLPQHLLRGLSPCCRPVVVRG